MPTNMSNTKIPHLLHAALIYVILSFKFTESVPEGALVSQIPGFNGTFPSEHYSGYLSFHLLIYPLLDFNWKWSFSVVVGL